MSDVSDYIPAIFGPFAPEPNLDELLEQLTEHNVTHFRTVGGLIRTTEGRLNPKSVPYQAIHAKTCAYRLVESFGHADLDRRQQAWIEFRGGNQWK